ncbi:unnamed protein product [Urochloa humidicola]
MGYGCSRATRGVDGGGTTIPQALAGMLTMEPSDIATAFRFTSWGRIPVAQTILQLAWSVLLTNGPIRTRVSCVLCF